MSAGRNDHDLLAQARERAEAAATPPEWGYRLALEEREEFLGRWRGEAVDELNDDRRVFLLLDDDGEPCFSRTYAALGREIDRVSPIPAGAAIAIVRGADYTSAQGTGYSFGVAIEPNDDPLPETPAAADLPF
jgi:hypothetical protein